MLVRQGHTYVAAADVPSWVPLSTIRSRLIDAGFSNVSVREEDGAGYNVIGRATWTRADREVDLPEQIVWVRDVTPQEVEEPAPPTPTDSATAVVPTPTPTVAPTAPTAPTVRRRRRAPAPPAAPTVDRGAIVTFALGGAVLVGWLWKRKRAEVTA